MSLRKSQSKSVLQTNSFKKELRIKKFLNILIKLVLVFLGISTIAGLILLIQFLTYFVKPVNLFKEFQVQEHEVWNGETQINVGLWLRQEGTPTLRNGLLVVKPDVGSVHVILFPENNSSKNPQQLSYEYAIPVDRYVVATQNFNLHIELKDSIQELIDEFYVDYTELSGYARLYRNLQNVSNYIYTDSSPRELFNLYQLLRSIPSDAFSVVNWSTDAQEFNTIQETILQEQEIQSASVRLWVRNTTDIPGLAAKVATMGENLGFDVVRVDNASCATPTLEMICDGINTTIVTKDDLILTRAILRLEDVFTGESKTEHIEDLKRADAVIYVGSDVEEILSQKQKALHE